MKKQRDIMRVYQNPDTIKMLEDGPIRGQPHGRDPAVPAFVPNIWGFNVVPAEQRARELLGRCTANEAQDLDHRERVYSYREKYHAWRCNGDGVVWLHGAAALKMFLAARPDIGCYGDTMPNASHCIDWKGWRTLHGTFCSTLARVSLP